MYMMKKNRSSYPKPHTSSHLSQAFTLVEMIVALGIFSIVAVVALGALVKIISANHKAQTLQASITNLNFALDAMSREMRVGNTYYCHDGNGAVNNNGNNNFTSNPCTGSQTRGGNQSTLIAFNSSEVDSTNSCNLIYAYLFDYQSSSGIKLKKYQQTDCYDIISNADFTTDDTNILDPSVTITSYYVNVVNTAFPRATIRVSGYAGISEKEKTYFDVQTTVSARVQ
ncbi:MAG: hypothetical protein RL536_69 [Candidatus Parcubacteria bacterium]|jgi:prepilin-type N-terminal cleavage/methylation domain-containing protein